MGPVHFRSSDAEAPDRPWRTTATLRSPLLLRGVQALFDGVAGQLDPVVQLQLVEHVLGVVLHGPVRNGESIGDLQAGQTLRDLAKDLRVIHDSDATALVSLIEDPEIKALGVPSLGRDAEALGLEWHHLPIRDASVPDAVFEARCSM